MSVDLCFNGYSLTRTDYAAPEVLQGRPYGGKEQDVWALGILLYTIAYKENPFYNLGTELLLLKGEPCQLTFGR